MGTQSEVNDVAEETSTTNIWVDIHGNIVYDNAFKDINKLFSPYENGNPYMILIEGAPGIGKTEFTKEIALQWANNSILNNTKLLFLLFMRDTRIKYITDIHSLVRYFYQSDVVSKNITDWLVKTDGKHTTIIFDGYDELSADSKRDSIIEKIITRQVLTQCGIVITSRPIASSCFHKIVNCRAELLGLTEENRREFINNALQGEKDKIKKLDEYLLTNQRLSLLCHVPFNMSILLCLATERIEMLPKTSTALYERFILMTITHFLVKDKLLPTASITEFTDVPPPYDQVIKELSHFAFLALQKDQLVFTRAGIRAECPNLTPANWFGGLLKPVKYFKPQDDGDHKSFHFLHYSIQEYMAAYYIASLPDNELLLLLQKTFWNARYFNTWVMYIGITAGRHSAFTHFLSGNRLQVTSWLSAPRLISKRFLSDKIKCLHLLQCSVEADCDILLSVEDAFRGQTLSFRNNNLSIDDLRTLAMLLLQSPNKQWEILNLSSCKIGNSGCNIFCEIFSSHRVKLKVKKLDISCNMIQWESLSRICEISRYWQTEELFVSVDTLYDSAVMRLSNQFTHKLSEFIKGFQSASPHSAYLTGRGILFCTYMAKERRAIAVYFNPQNCYIACHHLANCELKNTFQFIFCLAERIGLNRIGSINFNFNINYIHTRVLSSMLCHFQKVTFFGSNMHSKGAYLLNIPLAIYYNDDKPYQIVTDYLAAVLCHIIKTKTSYYNTLPQSRTIAVSNILAKISFIKVLNFSNSNIGKEGAVDIAIILTHTSNLQEIYLSKNNLQSAGAITIARALKNIVTLTLFDLSHNNISEEAADDIAVVLSRNTKLQALLLNGNNFQSAGVIKITKILYNIVMLNLLALNCNNIKKEAADYIAAVLSRNTLLQHLYLGHNNLESAGAIKIARALRNTVTLLSIDLRNNFIGEEAADDIETVLSRNTRLRNLWLAENNLQSAGAIKIAKGLRNTVTLTSFDLSSNNVSKEAADYIAVILSQNTKLQEIKICRNNLQSAGASMIGNSLHNTLTLISFDLSYSNICKEASGNIADALSHNVKLQEIYLGGNNLQSAGAIKVARVLHNNANICVFDLSYNNINEDAAGDIAAVLSHNTKISVLHLGGNNLQSSGAIKISTALRNTANLISFELSDNNISAEAADDIATVISSNTKLKELLLANNNLQSAGAIKIAKALHNTVSLISFDLSGNNISEEAADDIAAVLSQNTMLQLIKMGKNNLKSAGASRIARALHNNTFLHAFDLSDSKINEEAADDIAAVLSCNTKLLSLNLGGNSLQSLGIIKIAKALQNMINLVSFDITSNNVNEEAADDIAAVLSCNTKIRFLKLGENSLQSAGAIKIARALHNTVTLSKLDLNNNNISEEAADDIASALSHITQLEELSLRNNNLQSAGAIKIARALCNTVTLISFDLSSNNIDEEAAEDIANVLSHNTKLKVIQLGGNNLQSTGAIKVARSLCDAVSLVLFDLTNSNIGVEIG